MYLCACVVCVIEPRSLGLVAEPLTAKPSHQHQHDFSTWFWFVHKLTWYIIAEWNVPLSELFEPFCISVPCRHLCLHVSCRQLPEEMSDRILFPLPHRWPCITGTCPRHCKTSGAGKMRQSCSCLRRMQMCSSRGWGTRWSFGSHWMSPSSLLPRAMAVECLLQVKALCPACQLFAS